jgi:hypothetical protein
MVRVLAILLLSALFSAAAVTSAQQQFGSASDENAIVMRLNAYAAAKMRRDARAEAACFTDDADLRIGTDAPITGRANIERAVTMRDPAFRFSLEPASLRFLSDDVAIVEVDITTGVQSPLTKMVGSYLMVRRNVVEWLIGAVRIVPAPAAP